MPRVLIEIYEGQIVRNLLENRLLDVLAEAGSDVLVVTPGARVPSFLARFERPGVAFRDLSARPPDRWEQYELSLGQQLLQGGRKGLRRALGRHVGERLAVRSGPLAVGLIDEWGPDVVVSTYVSQVYGRGLVAAARRRGIPTLGNLNSWDNAYKGLKVFTDRITCWSENNKEEVCRTAGYEPDDVAVIGAPAFDAYLAPDSHWSREELAGRIGLDARRPILLFATLGQFQQNIDETNPLEVLLREADAGRIPGDPQVVLRMHPWSRDVYFGALMRHSRVTVSRYENYVPGLTWTPTRQEAVLAGNLLRHADVVITPGSTMSIEPAIFDTPTVVPVFNEYMPEVFESYFRRTWLDQHFKALHDHGWVPIVRSGEEMTAAINRALRDPTWNRSGQARIREVYLGPLDGRATERFAEQIVRTASRSPIA